MKMSSRSVKKTVHTFLSRVAACLLLTGVVYSTTFGSLHSHGSVSSFVGTNVSTGDAKQAHALSTQSIYSRSNETECLICVLHRQFSGSVVENRFSTIAETPAKIQTGAKVSYLYHSDAISCFLFERPSGRAPPFHRA